MFWRVGLVVRRRNVGLRGGNRYAGRPFGCLEGGSSKFGLYAGGVLNGETPLSLQEVDVRPGLGDEMEDES